MEMKVTIEGMKKVVARKEYLLTEKTFLQGVNGAGKSTINEAIEIAIKGRTPRGEQTLSDIMKLASADKMVVGIKIEGGIQIERTFRVDSKGKNSQTVFINGKKMNQKPAEKMIAEYFGDFLTKQNFSSVVGMSAREKAEMLFQLFGHLLEGISAKEISRNYMWNVLKLDENFHNIARFRMGKTPEDVDADIFTDEERVQLRKDLMGDLKTRKNMEKAFSSLSAAVNGIPVTQPVQDYLDALCPAIKNLVNVTQENKLSKQKTIKETKMKMQGVELDVATAKKEAKEKELAVLVSHNESVAETKDRIAKKKEYLENIVTVPDKTVTNYQDMLISKNVQLSELSRERDVQVALSNELKLKVEQAKANNEKKRDIGKRLTVFDETPEQCQAAISEMETTLSSMREEKEKVVELQEKINKANVKKLMLSQKFKEAKSQKAKADVVRRKKAVLESLKTQLADIDTSDLQNEIDSLELSISEKQDSLAELSQKIEGKRSIVASKLSDIEKFKAGSCPLCGTAVAHMSYDVAAVKKDIDKESGLLSKLEEASSELSVKLTADKERQEALNRQIKELDIKKAGIKDEISAIAAFIEINNVKEDTTDYQKKIAATVASIEKLKSKLSSMEIVNPDALALAIMMRKKKLAEMQEVNRITELFESMEEQPVELLVAKQSGANEKINEIFNQRVKLQAEIEELNRKIKAEADLDKIRESNAKWQLAADQIIDDDSKEALIEEEMKLRQELADCVAIYESAVKDQGSHERIRDWQLEIELLDAQRKYFLSCYNESVRLKNNVIGTMLKPTISIASKFLSQIFPDAEIVIDTHEWGIRRRGYDNIIVDFSDGEKVLFFTAVFVALLISSNIKKKIVAIELGEVDDGNIEKLMTSLDAIDELDMVTLMSFPRASTFERDGWDILKIK